MSCQFRSPKVAKKKFLCSNFQSPKVQDKEKWAVDVFRKWQATREKNHTLYPGECVQSVQSLEDRLEDLHSLSLNFCLTKFLRKIERAFVQVFSTPLLINFQTHVFGYPNTYFWIYKIFI